MATFQPEQVSLTYTAAFQEPALEFPTRWGDLYSAAYARLSPLGLKPSEARFDSASTNPSDFSFACFLLDLGVAIRFRLMSIELWASKSNFSAPEHAVAIVEHAFAVLRDVSPETVIATHTIDMGVHGRLNSGDGAALLRQLVPSLPGGGPELLVAGVTLKARLERGLATLDLQPSLVFVDPSMLFVRVQCALSGDMAEAEACRVAMESGVALLTRFGLELPERQS